MIKRVIIQPLYLALLAGVFLFACEEENVDPGPEIVSGAIIDAEVGGETQPNQVFVDLSSETQTTVQRDTWDLAFYNGSEFRVKLNSAVGMLAYQLEATELTEVAAEDTVGLGAKLDIGIIFSSLMGPPPSWIGETAAWVDAPDGDLSGTAIAEISETDEENMVYIINRGSTPEGANRGWFKIRILNENGNYLLRYADINSSTYEEVEVAKDEKHHFSFVNFDDGSVNVEPEKSGWDIAFTTYTNLIPISGTTFIPYFYNDYVIQNPDAEVAEVVIADVSTYEEFEYDDIASLTFNSEINFIGSAWRNVAQPGTDTETGPKDDRFYVIKDPEGNYYKFRFTGMLHPETGERGFPQIEYELLVSE